jgi:hypothetical protein
VRRGLAQSRRNQWDAGNTPEQLPHQLTLLLAFFTPLRMDDIGRLETVAPQIQQPQFLSREDIRLQLPRLAHITLQALEGIPLADRAYGTGFASIQTLLSKFLKALFIFFIFLDALNLEHLDLRFIKRGVFFKMMLTLE